jgi:protein SCO1/2
MSRATTWVSLLLALLVPLAAVAEPKANDPFKSGTFDPPRVAPDFELAGSNSSTVKISRLRGKVVVLAFGFTHCERICPVTLSILGQMSKKLGAAASQVQVVFVTVDPERDSPERLREYLANFNPTFIGVTGNAEQLEAVRTAYGIGAKKEAGDNAALGYQVHHSSFFYVIDRQGKLRLLVPFGKPPDDIVHDIKLLLGP